MARCEPAGGSWGVGQERKQTAGGAGRSQGCREGPGETQRDLQRPSQGLPGPELTHGVREPRPDSTPRGRVQRPTSARVWPMPAMGGKPGQQDE